MDIRLGACAAAVFKNVSKVYRVGWSQRSVVALDDVSLVVGWGEVLGLIGPNRAGKTTLVKVLLSICRASEGRVMRLEQSIAQRTTLAQVGYVHENPAFPRYLNARQLVEGYGRMSGVDRGVLSRRAEELLHRVGLADRSRETIETFSKGMLQRLALAQALVNDPRLLVLDEPAEGMDLPARRLLDEVICERRRQGHSVILVSHALADVKRLCDRVAVLRGGRLAYLGTITGLAGHENTHDGSDEPLESRRRGPLRGSETMKDSPVRSTLTWLVVDTFRQARANGILVVLVAISLLSIAVCATVGVTGPDTLSIGGDPPDFLPRIDAEAGETRKLEQSGVTVAGGTLTLAFGAISVPIARDKPGAIHFLELLLAGGVADTLGLMLALIWTAGFLPTFLDARSISVLLAKPAPRWVLLLGKYLGVLAFVGAYALLFVVGTWTAIGLRTGFWDATYLLSIPLLLLHFSVFFVFSVLLAVCTRSTVVCVFGSLVFWCVAWSMNFGRHAFFTSTDMAGEAIRSPLLSWVIDVGYWILPKPADLGVLFYDALGAQDHFGELFDPSLLADHGFSMTLSVLSSLAFAVVVLFVSVRTFGELDY